MRAVFLIIAVLAGGGVGLAGAGQDPPSPRLDEYLGLAERTLAEPIRPEELDAAALSPDGVATIRRLFERSIEDALGLAGELVTPELGGEATLGDDGRLRLLVYPDPKHAVVRGLVDRRDDPRAMLSFLEGSFEGREILRETGGLHALLFRLARGTGPPSGADRRLLDEVLASAVRIHFKTWSTDPLVQRAMIERYEWTGRYVGFWHLHPPRWTAAGFAEGIEPSEADRANAVALGQFLTIVFQPEGFDLYDLAPLGRSGRADLAAARRVRYRDAAWRAHFEAVARAPRRPGRPHDAPKLSN